MTEQLPVSQPIVFADGTAQRPFVDYLRRLAAALPIIGQGSPEGVVEAPQYSLYIDANGVSGSIEYRKMQTDIGGDRKQGWVAV